jgi:hypothetical protein
MLDRWQSLGDDELMHALLGDPEHLGHLRGGRPVRVRPARSHPLE